MASHGAGTTFCGGTAEGGVVENCCEQPLVPGGTYDRVYGVGPDGGSVEAGYPATVSSFRLDEYLVTVARFRQFVKAVNGADGGTPWMPAAGSGKHSYLNHGMGLANVASPGTYETGWVAANDSQVAPTSANLICDPNYATWTDTPSGTSENKPINCVNWYEAYAFCIWDDGFLPSEAEWGYAAAGGVRQFEYPWGSAAPGDTNQYAIYGCDWPFGDGHSKYAPGGESCGSNENIAVVGSTPAGAGLWGQLDLSGEVFEWTLDLVKIPYVSGCDNCAYLNDSTGMATGGVVRGGAYDVSDHQITSTFRSEENYPQRSPEVGFRCARPPFGEVPDAGSGPDGGPDGG